MGAVGGTTVFAALSAGTFINPLLVGVPVDDAVGVWARDAAATAATAAAAAAAAAAYMPGLSGNGGNGIMGRNGAPGRVGGANIVRGCGTGACGAGAVPGVGNA